MMINQSDLASGKQTYGNFTTKISRNFQILLKISYNKLIPGISIANFRFHQNFENLPSSQNLPYLKSLESSIIGPESQIIFLDR